MPATLRSAARVLPVSCSYQLGNTRTTQQLLRWERAQAMTDSGRERANALSRHKCMCVCVCALCGCAHSRLSVCVCEWAREVGKQKSIATANRLQEAPYNMARSRAKRTWTTQHSAAAAAAAEALELTLASSSPATPHRIPRRTQLSPTPSVEASHSRKMITG